MLTKARLVVLLIAVGAGGGAIWFSGQISPPAVVQQPTPAPAIQMTEVLVAAKDLEPGHRLQSGDVRWQTWPADATPVGSLTRISGADLTNEVQGAFVRSAISAGDPVRRGKLLKGDGQGFMAAIVEAGMRAVSTEITPETGVAGFVLPNDRVDVLLTRVEKSGPSGKEAYITDVLFRNVRVLAIDQAVGDAGGKKVVPGKIVTLELSPQQGEHLALARRLGTISLMLRAIRDQTSIGLNPENSEGLRTIDVVRFGVATPTPLR